MTDLERMESRLTEHLLRIMAMIQGGRFGYLSSDGHVSASAVWPESQAAVSPGQGGGAKMSTPGHYETYDRCEAVDLIRAFVRDDSLTPIEVFFLGNVLKYLYRFNHKGDRDGDLRKAAHYIEMLRRERDA